MLGDVLMTRPFPKIRASPSLVRRICPRGRFDQFERARSITGMGGAYYHADHRCIATRDRGIRHESAVVSRRLSSTFSALSCWFLDLARWISVARLASRLSAWSRFPTLRLADDHHCEPLRGLPRRDSPPEKDPIVTQLVTRGHGYSLAHSL